MEPQRQNTNWNDGRELSGVKDALHKMYTSVTHKHHVMAPKSCSLSSLTVSDAYKRVGVGRPGWAVYDDPRSLEVYVDICKVNQLR